MLKNARSNLEKAYSGIEVEESFIRRYKPVPGRLRPEDVMIGHTGYLIFTRNIEPEILPQRRRKRTT